VAFTLKRDAPSVFLIPTFVTRPGPCCSFSPAPGRDLLRGGHGPARGHAQFIESRTTQIGARRHRPKEIGEILGRYNDGIAIRNVDWGVGNSYIRDVAKASRVPVLICSATSTSHQALADL